MGGGGGRHRCSAQIVAVNFNGRRTCAYVHTLKCQDLMWQIMVSLTPLLSHLTARTQTHTDAHRRTQTHTVKEIDLNVTPKDSC